MAGLSAAAFFEPEKDTIFVRRNASGDYLHDKRMRLRVSMVSGP